MRRWTTGAAQHGGVSSLRYALVESWALVGAHRAELARYAFARLFLTHPEAHRLFPAAAQAQLLTAVDTTVRLYDDPDALDFYLRALARGAGGYQRRHLETLGAALLAGAREYAGPAWRPVHDEAWQQALRLVTATVLSCGRPAGGGDAEVVAHRRVAADLAVLTVAPAAGLRWLPGQYLPVETGHHPGLWRAFAVANAPRPDQTLQLHVQAVDGGRVSDALVRRVRVGDRLRLGEPAGDLLLDRRSSRDILCVTAGTGLAPMLALLDELVSYNRTRWVHLFVGGHDRAQLYELPRLRRLAARHPWLSVVPVLTADPAVPGRRGRLAQFVAEYGPWLEHDCFVAGPAAQVQPTVTVLERLRVPAPRIRHMSFQAPTPVGRQPSRSPAMAAAGGGRQS